VPVLDDASATGLTLAALGGVFVAPLHDGVARPFDAALDRLRRAGVRIDTAVFNDTGAIHPAYVDVVLHEAAEWHALYLDTRRELYSPNVHARLLAGREITPERYRAALDTCARLAAAVDAIFDTTAADALVLPTVPITAPRLGESEVDLDGQAINVRTAMLRNTQLFNMTGHPAISLPLAVESGWPAGCQLVGRRGATADLLAIAARCEKIVC
jgi:aspartyl-tRNA(Asn)/glutamyl-tRNA(Gln) amidotransferase subunit A